MAEQQLNGKAQEIHDNVIFIRGSVTRLERSIDGLSVNVERLSMALEKNNESSERIISHMADSIPLKFVVLICLIICLAFVGGGVLKEIVDSHILLKIFG